MCDNHYIIIGYSGYNHNALSELTNQKNCTYIDCSLLSKFERVLSRVVDSQKTPTWLKQLLILIFGLDRLGFDIAIRKSIKYRKNVLVLFESSMYAHNVFVQAELKKRVGGLLCACVLTNVVRDTGYYDNSRFYEFARNNSFFNAILTFNRQDAQLLNLNLYTQFMSRISFEKNDLDEADVFFCGINKGRHELICKIYDMLTKVGLTCNFVIISTNENIKKHPGIKYFNEIVDNSEMLRMVSQSKCVLEVLVDSINCSESLRFAEAIAYKKKLLTNCRQIINNKLYNKKQMSVFSSPETIDIDFLKRTISDNEYVPPDLVSPSTLLDSVDYALTASK